MPTCARHIPAMTPGNVLKKRTRALSGTNSLMVALAGKEVHLPGGSGLR